MLVDLKNGTKRADKEKQHRESYSQMFAFMRVMLSSKFRHHFLKNYKISRIKEKNDLHEIEIQTKYYKYSNQKEKTVNTYIG